MNIDDEDDQDTTATLGPDDDDDQQDDNQQDGDGEEGDDDDQPGEVNDELVVEIEGFDDGDEIEVDKPDDSAGMRQVRARLRDVQRELYEERQKASRDAGAAEQEIVVGEKPTLESCEWDEERFERELDEWKQRKSDADTRVSERQRVEQQHRQKFDQARQAQLAHATRIAKPEVYQAAEAAVGAALPQVLGNAITMYFGERGPALVLALHKRPDLLARITEKAKTDLVGSILDLHDMSKGVKMVKPAKKTFEREDAGRGSASMRQAAPDKELERLEKEADRTRDRTKLVAYKKQLREKQQQKAA